MTADLRAAAVSAVLRRNDRYLSGLVEAHNVCPFARPCREQGKLWRAISFATADGIVDRALALATQLEAVSTPVEVALLLMPGLRGIDPIALDRIHAQLRESYRGRAGGASFYVVPFHPDYPLNARDPGALVRFWRRSPDPTLQFVHIETLESLRRADPRDQHSRLALSMLGKGHSAEQVLAALEAMPQRQGTSQRVAEQNYERFTSQGAERFEAAIDAAREPSLPPLDPSWADVPFAAAGGLTPL